MLSLNTLSAEKERDDIYSLIELKVINSNIFPVLDTIIQMRNCTKFKTTKLFTIEFNQDSIKIDLIFVTAQEKQIHFAYLDVGYFDYKEYTFVVRSSFIDSSIFQKTNKRRNFNFSIPQTEYTKEGTPNLRTYSNFAVWTIRNKQGNFKVLSFFTDDKKDKWFDYIEEEYNEK